MDDNTILFLESDGTLIQHFIKMVKLPLWALN